MQHIILCSLSPSLSLSFSLPASVSLPLLLPNFPFHIAETSIKAVFPLAAVSMTAHTDTMRHSPGSAANHNQLVNNWHRFIIISSGNQSSTCELTHTADRELQALPLLFKTEVNPCATEVGEQHSAPHLH